MCYFLIRIAAFCREHQHTGESIAAPGAAPHFPSAALEHPSNHHYAAVCFGFGPRRRRLWLTCSPRLSRSKTGSRPPWPPIFWVRGQPVLCPLPLASISSHIILCGCWFCFSNGLRFATFFRTSPRFALVSWSYFKIPEWKLNSRVS